jgi:hypothetical protein
MTKLLAESATFLGFEHPFGGTISVLGAFLLGIGWVGKRRLEKWDAAVQKYFEIVKAWQGRNLRRLGEYIDQKAFPFIVRSSVKIFRGFKRSLWVLMPMMFAFFALGFWADYMKNKIPNWVWDVFVIGSVTTICVLCLFLVALFLPVIVLTVIILPAYLVLFISVLLRMPLAPYLMTRRVEEEDALERTFLLVGTVLSVIGIGMCLWTKPG